MTAASDEHDHGDATRVLHLGRDPETQAGFVNTPIYRGSTVIFPNVAAMKTPTQRYTYGRHGTPTTTALTDALTALEGGHRTWLAPSGLAAITAVLLAFAGAGDHVLIADSAYFPTRRAANRLLKRMGVETSYYDPLIGGGIAELITDKTRLIIGEAPGSLTFEMQDLPAIAAAARARDVIFAVDNTWATPLYCKPLTLGVDVSIHAATKYITGHSDALLGAVICNERAAGTFHRAYEDLGLCVGPDDAYLGLRGIRTLAVRLAQHQAAALELARWLQTRPEVARVLHPGLPGDPGHALWQRDFTGASGLFSVILKPCPAEAVAAMLDGFKLFALGYSWGGFESLVIPFDPVRTATARQAEGPAIRLHVGLDDIADLKADLEAGFARLRAASPRG